MNEQQLAARVEELRAALQPVKSEVPLTHALISTRGEPVLACGASWASNFWIICRVVLVPYKAYQWDRPEAITTVCPQCQEVLDAL